MEMWPAYLIEVVVIILGIWITLGLEQWREHHKNIELEESYRINLLHNIGSDRILLRNCTDQTNNVLSKIDELQTAEQNFDNPSLTVGKIDSDLITILNRPKFISRDATFSDLKSSGNMRLISDLRLKELLFDYYGMAQNIKEGQDSEQQATINITGPYFLKNFPLDNSGKERQLSESKLRMLFNGIEFANNIALRASNRHELLIEYRQADSLAAKIVSLLNIKGD